MEDDDFEIIGEQPISKPVIRSQVPKIKVPKSPSPKASTSKVVPQKPKRIIALKIERKTKIVPKRLVIKSLIEKKTVKKPPFKPSSYNPEKKIIPKVVTPVVAKKLPSKRVGIFSSRSSLPTKSNYSLGMAFGSVPGFNMPVPLTVSGPVSGGGGGGTGTIYVNTINNQDGVEAMDLSTDGRIDFSQNIIRGVSEMTANTINCIDQINVDTINDFNGDNAIDLSQAVNGVIGFYGSQLQGISELDVDTLDCTGRFSLRFGTNMDTFQIVTGSYDLDSAGPFGAVSGAGTYTITMIGHQNDSLITNLYLTPFFGPVASVPTSQSQGIILQPGDQDFLPDAGTCFPVSIVTNLSQVSAVGTLQTAIADVSLYITGNDGSITNYQWIQDSGSDQGWNGINISWISNISLSN